MNCHDAQSMMHGYLDGEIDPSLSLQYEQHARECPVCSKALAEHQALQAQMKAAPLYFKAPDIFRERVRSSLRKQHGARFPRIFLRWVAAAACVVFLIGLGFLLARFTSSLSGSERLTQEVASAHIRLTQEVASAHIRSLQEEHIVDVRSSDKHKVKPWFKGKLDFSPPTTDLKQHGFPLVGGRLDYLDGRPVAALVYSRRDHLINVFVWPASGSEPEGIRQQTRQGYHCIYWSKDGMNYWVVSDLDSVELNEMVGRLRE
jgi:anti-sigma factor RsiW